MYVFCKRYFFSLLYIHQTISFIDIMRFSIRDQKIFFTHKYIIEAKLLLEATFFIIIFTYLKSKMAKEYLAA